MNNTAQIVEAKAQKLEMEKRSLVPIPACAEQVQTINGKLSYLRQTLQSISKVQNILSIIYNVIAQISEVAAIYACIVGIAATLVGIIEGAGGGGDRGRYCITRRVS